ncbi:UNVERIFIED_CONTAM: pEARLI1-like lipid transfer protein 1 [Sesamum calycinum]|uniref:PEARLI1-like lipid transfer protein 1 n=1 Tax=Sesamum calycinum TaxID=2727403 RepID=A0AAW2LZ83_9LAMI
MRQPSWFVDRHTSHRETSKEQCCGLIQGLVDLDAAVCVCTAIKAGVLGIIPINIDLAIGILLNACGKDVPSGFHCA